MRVYFLRKAKRLPTFNLKSSNACFSLMKKTFFMLAAVSCMSLAAQIQNSNILKSTDVKEIETFLKTAQRDDPRRGTLTKKLAVLKSKSPVNFAKQETAAPKPVANQAPKFAGAKSEDEEFRKLTTGSAGTHEQKTVKLLNQLFDNDVTNKEAILLIQNHSDCNMIIRVYGKESYNLPVRAGGENFVVLKKGNYELSGTACNDQYTSAKSIAKNTIVTLNRTGGTLPQGKYAQNAGATK